MPLEDHGCQYKDDNEYDDPGDQRQAPRCFYGRSIRTLHSETRGEPKVVDDHNEEPRDKTTARSSRKPTYCRHVSCCRGSGESSVEPSVEYLNSKQRWGVALKESQRPSKVAAVVEAA